MKQVFTIRTINTHLSEKSRRHYKYNEHKPVLMIESSHRFPDHTPIYFMRCVRCLDLLAWEDGKFQHGGVHR